MTKKYIESLSQFERGTYINRFEIEWCDRKENKKFIKEVMHSHPLIQNDYYLQVGTMIFACKYLDDKGRVRIADALSNKLTQDAKERIPHLEYLLNDPVTWGWLNPAGWLVRRDKEELMDFIVQQKEFAEKGIRKHINEKTYVNWKMSELIDLLLEEKVSRQRDHIDVIYHIFKACDYEHYGSTSDNVLEKDHRNTIKQRIKNNTNSIYPKQPTSFTFWKKKIPDLAF